jgi:PAS domain S-box-containing protein
MEVTLSRKGAKSRTPGRKPHLTEARARVGRAPKTRADLEQELKTCRREIAQARERLAEAAMQQAAASEMLRLIANSPIQSVLDAVAENAVRLSDANNAEIFRLENNRLRLVASYGEIPVVIHAYQGVPVNRDTVTGRAACDRRTIHVHDLAAEEGQYPVGSVNAKREGHRTTLGTPLLREGIPIGIILVRRSEVRPFSNQQIALIETFADQAVIAIENARLIEAEKQRTLALANANRDLAEREAKIRRLVDSNIIGIYIWEFGGRIIEANDAFLRMVGYHREDLVSDHIHWADLTPPEWLDRDKRLARELRASGSLQPFEKEYFRKDGCRVPVLVGAASFDESGNEGVAFVLDLTERKRADEALREREAKIRRLVESNIVGILIWDFDGRVLEANDEFLRMVDYNREDLVSGRIRWPDLTPPDWRDRNNARIEQQKSSGRFKPIEKEYLRRDGSRVPVLSGGATFEQGGNQGVAFVVDLTDRKRAEQALMRSEAYLIETQKLTHTGSWAWDARNQRVLYCSEEMLRIFGLDPQEDLPTRKNFRQRVHPEDRNRVDESFARVVNERVDSFDEYRVVLPDGTVKQVYSSGHPVLDANGELIEFVGTATDITERKRAEEALRDSEYKLRQIIETVPSLLWSTDPNGEPTHINQRMLDYSGMRFEDFKQSGWHAFLHPDDLAETLRAFSHAIQTGTPYQRVNRLRRADGEFRWHDIRGEPLRDRQGRIIQWYGQCVDIDEGKKFEDALRRSEAYLAEAQRLSHSGVSAYSETAILYGSEETYRIWGFDPAQGVPSREAVFQRIHPDDRERLSTEVQRAVSERRDYSTAYRIVLPDGTIKHLETIGRPAFSGSGELVEIVTTQMDVTVRKRAEEALRESEAKFRDYAETASDWLWETGPDHKFTRLTENAFGSDPADRIGTTCSDYALDLETEPAKWRLFQATIDARKPFRDFVYCSVGGNGSQMYVKKSGNPVFDINGEFVGYRGTSTDVTAIVRAQRAEASLRTVQAELAHVSRVMTLGQLTASIAHEVNQPIGSARNNARAALNFLDRSPPDLGEVREALGCIVADADRAGGIIDRIRDQIKKAPPRSDRFDLNQAIEEVIGLAQSTITENGVSVQTRLASGMAPVQGDRVQLQQVVLNLILNAVEAMSSVETDERELLISTDQSQANGTVVAVRDSGPGIDPRHLERVFEAFYSTKSGMGMGLSICRSIIAAHGGRLWAAATERKGALFQFTLPSAEAKPSIVRPVTALQSGKKASL